MRSATRALTPLLFVALLLCSSRVADAQEPGEAKSTVLGGSLAVAFPTGDFGDLYGIGFGGFMHLAHHFNSRVAVTGTFGVLHHLREGDTQLTEIPLLGGANLYLIDNKKLFVFAQVGVNSLRVSVDLGIADATDSETQVGANLGAGVELGPGIARAAIVVPSLGDLSDGFNVMGAYELAIVEL